MPIFNWRFAKLVICLFISLACASAVDVVDAETLGPNELREATWSRREYFGKVFRYRIAFEREPGGVVPEEATSDGIRVLEIGQSVPGQTAVPIRLFHSINNPGEPHISDEKVTTYWEAFDGTESRGFARQTFANARRASLEYRSWRKAGANIPVILSDPLFLALFWESTVTSRFTGSPQPPFTRLDDLKIEKVEHAVAGGALRISPKKDEGPIEADPKNGILPISSTMWTTTYDASSPYVIVAGSVADPLVDLDIKSLYSTADGSQYPGEGEYRDGRMIVRFELISVQESATPLAMWFPEWPRGTAVVDRIDGKVDRVPFTPDEKRKIISAMRVNQVAATGRPPSTLPFVLLLNGLLVVAAVGWILFKKFKNQS